MFKFLMRFSPKMEVDGGAGAGAVAAQQQQGAAQIQTQEQQGAAAVDYNKIQQMLEGTLSAKEDTALKAYFKQQGMSQDEMNQAINAFKEQKAAAQPDVEAMQDQLDKANKVALQAQIKEKALLMSAEVGTDLKTMPYLLKMADLTEVAAEDGQIADEKLKAALEKVLDDIPQLKPQQQETQRGFKQIGAGNGGTGQQDNDQLSAIFGNKKK
ncbi:MAG: hypothetical protein RSD18_04925 [Anaerovoracaceae bacterium]